MPDATQIHQVVVNLHECRRPWAKRAVCWLSPLDTCEFEEDIPADAGMLRKKGRMRAAGGARYRLRDSPAIRSPS